MKKSFLNTMLDDGLSLFSLKESGKLRTDIREYDDYYLFDIDVAGHDKKDIEIRLDDEYMIIEVKSVRENEESNMCDECDTYQYIRKERYVGSTSRSYYVGNVVEKDIKASYSNGLLTINVPKEKSTNNVRTKIKID